MRRVYVSRYVGPSVEAELGRLRRADAPEMLIVTDLGLEPVAVTFIESFVAMNARGGASAATGCSSSSPRVVARPARRAGLTLEAATGPDAPGLKRVAVDDPAVTVLIGEGRCATRLAFDHRDFYASRTPDAEVAAAIPVLVAAIDAVDLWRKDDPIFTSRPFGTSAHRHEPAHSGGDVVRSSIS